MFKLLLLLIMIIGLGSDVSGQQPLVIEVRDAEPDVKGGVEYYLNDTPRKIVIQLDDNIVLKLDEVFKNGFEECDT